MSFLITCPICGPRNVYEFRFGGEVQERPDVSASEETWTDYLYIRKNESGRQAEWWHHRSGCKIWFQAMRDTAKNEIIESERQRMG